MIGHREDRRAHGEGRHPAEIVVAYTFGLIGILAASGYAAVDFGVNPAWLVLASGAVIALGAIAVVLLQPRASDDDDDD